MKVFGWAIPVILIFNLVVFGIPVGIWWFWVHRKPPAIAGFLRDYSVKNPRGHFDRAEVDKDLGVILNLTFPKRTKVETMKRELLRQGFQKVPPPHPKCGEPYKLPQGVVVTYPCYDHARRLRYAWGDGLVCSSAIIVEWRDNEQGEITSVSGHYGSSCR
jgi:hypothetical protein